MFFGKQEVSFLKKLGSRTPDHSRTGHRPDVGPSVLVVVSATGPLPLFDVPQCDPGLRCTEGKKDGLTTSYTEIRDLSTERFTTVFLPSERSILVYAPRYRGSGNLVAT